MKEIVTIQVGNYANFTGSHFWNFQDEILGLAEDPQSDLHTLFKNHRLDMDVLYRTGETHQGVLTYTPRLVSIDFQGSLGSMSSCGTCYNDFSSGPSDVVTWTGSISTIASEPMKKNLFLQSLYEEEQGKQGVVTGFDSGNNKSGSQILDEDIVQCLDSGVEYWTDFSKVHFHPKSLYELNGLWINTQEFDNYGLGSSAFSEGLRGEEINERLRFFMEECDHIQGIQFIVDDSGGFSGLATEFLESIADDYTNIPLLLYTVRPPHSDLARRSRKQRISQNLLDALSFSRLSSLCKLIVPIGLPSLSASKASKFLCVNDEKPYHSSAVYASALHSISLPFRMEQLGPTGESGYASGALDVNGMIQMLAGQSRQNMVAVLDVAMPAPPFTSQSLLGNLHSLTPEIAEDVDDLEAVESMTVHGAFGSGCQHASISEVKVAVEAAYEHTITRPRFSHLSVSCSPLPIPLPFPSIFKTLVGRNGELLMNPNEGESRARGSLDVHSIPMAARLRSSSAVLPFLENRLGNLRRFSIERGAVGMELLRSWGFGQEEVEDMGETLSKLVMTLNPHSQASSDSD